MPESLFDTPGFAAIVARYRQLKENEAARQLLESAESSVAKYRHAERPRFPEIPFVEELYNGAWLDQSDATFAHGFNDNGKLSLIKWHNLVAYAYGDASIEGVFINHFGQRYEVQVVRHIDLDDQGKTAHVINLSAYRSFHREYTYDNGHLVEITTRHLQHTNLDTVHSDEIVIDTERIQNDIFTYSPDGKIKSGPEGNW